MFLKNTLKPRATFKPSRPMLAAAFQSVVLTTLLACSFLLVACGDDSPEEAKSQPQTQEAPAYLMASLSVTDFDAFQTNYGAPVFPMLAKAGGKVLVGTPQVDMLEGEYAQNWTVVVQFPSESAAQGWYNSQEYQAVVPERVKVTDSSTSRLMFAPAFGEASKAPELTPQSHYLMASLSVTDFDAFQTNYGAPVFPTITSAGGTVLVGTPSVNKLEGSYAPNWTVLVHFPSKQDATTWYNSSTYQSLVPKRQSATDPQGSWLMFAPAFNP